VNENKIMITILSRIAIRDILSYKFVK